MISIRADPDPKHCFLEILVFKLSLSFCYLFLSRKVMRSNTVKNQNNPADPPSGVHQLVLRPSLFFLHSCTYSINIVTVYKLFIQNVHYIVYYIHYTGYINNFRLILLSLNQVPSPRLFFFVRLY